MENSPTPGIIIQARLGSQRLANKVILPFFGEKGILEIQLERLKNAYPYFPIVLATTTNPNDSPLVELANRIEVAVYRGSETNVLQRFIAAATEYHIQTIIRVCSDNPFLDTELLSNLIRIYRERPVDYCSYQLHHETPAILTHFGLFAEIVTREALMKTAALTNDEKYLTHVTNYIYTHPKDFSIKYVDAPPEINNRDDIRLTIDTMDDFNLVRKLYSAIMNKNLSLNLKNILRLIDSNDDYTKQMKKQIHINKKQ